MRTDGVMGFWWDAEPEIMWRHVLDYVQTVERAQAETYERMVQCTYLYDPNDPSVGEMYEPIGIGQMSTGPNSCVIENVCASNVDTVGALICTTKVRARFMTDGATWSEQRKAKHLEYYAEGLTKLLDLDDFGEAGYIDATKKGTGLVKVWPDLKRGKVRIERIKCDDLIADEAECRNGGWPPHIHHRMFVSRAKLMREFPEHADAIERAGKEGDSLQRYWADFRPIERDELVAIESWKLPEGEPGDEDYVPGHHGIFCDNATLFYEEYEETYFPIAKAVWIPRDGGFYGISLIERVAGHQRQLNKSNVQIDRQIDLHAWPTTYVQMADARLAVATTNRVGSIVPYKVTKPETVIPQAVSPEVYARRQEVKASAFEETGVSQTAAMARKPAGIDSGVGMREYRDQTTIRHAPQERRYERFQLDIKMLALHACKRLGTKAPKVLHKTYRGRRQLKWGQVDMNLLKVQIEAASNLSRTPAGRLQMALEWAQAGVITMDEWRRLSRHPDLEAAMSLYTADLEDIERCIEEIFDGSNTIVPEPYQNLKMGIWRFQKAYNLAKNEDADESVCETLRQWIDIAAYMVDRASQPAAPPPGVPGAMPMAPAMPMLPEGPPQAPAMSAFAPESIGVAPV